MTLLKALLHVVKGLFKLLGFCSFYYLNTKFYACFSPHLYIAPCGKSSEYLLLSFTTYFIVPLCTMNTKRSGDILCGVCPIIVFSPALGFMKTTDNGSLGLPISRLQEISSPDRILSNLIIYVVATNHSVYLKRVTINILVWSFAVCTQLVHIYLDCFRLLSQVHVT